jgi:hypothetical protein
MKKKPAISNWNLMTNKYTWIETWKYVIQLRIKQNSFDYWIL